MACKNCRDNYIVKATSNEISWQGDAVEDLDICLNDSLTYVGNVILDKIQEFMIGQGIIIEDLTLADCTYLSTKLGANEKSLLNLFDIYKDAICELKSTSDNTIATLNAFTNVATYTLGCLPALDPCGEPYDFKALIQAIITKLCELNTQFESIASTILDAIEEGAGNMLIGGSVVSCGGNGIAYSGTGASAVVTFQALVPPNCPIIYRGVTGAPNFDATGAGLPNSPYCGWYLCNGNNGTPNSSTLPQNGGANTMYIIRFT